MSEAEGPAVRAEAQGAVFRITIDRPDRLNALTGQVVAALVEALEAARSEPEVRAVVITGAGERAFSAGGDLKSLDTDNPYVFDASTPGHFLTDALRVIERFPLPIVARVNGHAAGGGLGLLCACDLAVAADHARFGAPEVKVGLFPMTILPHMLRVIPRRKLMEMAITGDMWSAAEALEMGLVNYVVPAAELDDATDRLLARVVDKSPTAVRLGKHAVSAVSEMTMAQAFDFTQSFVRQVTATADATEGMAAFREKRDPDWTGR